MRNQMKSCKWVRSRGSQTKAHSYPWSWDAPPSQYMDMFTNPEAL